MMWIMLTKKLPTKPSPPKLSIFWGEPFVNEQIVLSQYARYTGKIGKKNLRELKYMARAIEGNKGKSLSDLITIDSLHKEEYAYGMKSYADGVSYNRHKSTKIFDDIFGFEDNELYSMGILYKGERIKVLAHEYSQLSDEDVMLYLYGDGDAETMVSHELVTSGIYEAETALSLDNPSPEIRDILDALMVDGCTSEQAIAVLLGYDVSRADASTIPRCGWYRCRPEYASRYCRDWEMEE